MTQSGDPLENAIAEHANGICGAALLRHAAITCAEMSFIEFTVNRTMDKVKTFRDKNRINSFHHRNKTTKFFLS